MKKIPHFMIAAPASGTGKTTVTLGLLRALKNRGMRVQPFKCGPDYIDTRYHHLASGKPSVNLDLFLSSANHVKQLYSKYAWQSEVSITEGVMGMFDGYHKMNGSSAEVAETLRAPVVLVVNAKSTAYSVAPLLYGFKHFSEKVDLIGVIFNFVGSDSHYSHLLEACEDAGITSFGYLPKNAALTVPSRHLGLTTESGFQYHRFIEKAAELIEQHIDIDKLLAATEGTICPPMPEHAAATPYKGIKIGVAKDEAFSFMYHENIESLKRMGEVCFFSPMTDHILPKADLLYFPGGYPELHLKALSENETMRRQVYDFARQGGRIVAECGGMMYLSSAISNREGTLYPMAGVFEQEATLADMKLKLGYRQFRYNNTPFRGHEFHYSRLRSNLPSATLQFNAKGEATDTKLLRVKNVIAGYTHLYWAEHDNLHNLFGEE